MSNVKTINLTGGETKINFGQKFMCFWVQNLGSGNVYVSVRPEAVPEADGVIAISSGTSARVSAVDLSKIDTLYLRGNGKVQIVGSYSEYCPFKTEAKGGDPGGGENKYIQNGLLVNIESFGVLSDNARGILESDSALITSTEEMTVECCFMYTSIPNSSGFGRIIDINVDGYNRKITFATTNGGAGSKYVDMEFNFGDAATWYTTGESQDPKISGIFPNINYTVTVVKKADTIAFYKDGEKTAELPYKQSWTPGANLSSIYVKNGTLKDRYIYGKLYSLRIYGRALSDSEVADNFAADTQNFRI